MDRSDPATFVTDRSCKHGGRRRSPGLNPPFAAPGKARCSVHGRGFVSLNGYQEKGISTPSFSQNRKIKSAFERKITTIACERPHQFTTLPSARALKKNRNACGILDGFWKQSMSTVSILAIAAILCR